MQSNRPRLERRERLVGRRYGGDLELTAFDQADHCLELRDVVFDHQHVACAASANPSRWSNAVDQRLFGDGFLQMRDGAGFERALLRFAARDDVHGNRARWPDSRELPEQLPAIDVRQADVERDRVGHVAIARAERLRRVCATMALKPRALREAQHDPCERRIVLDDEQRVDRSISLRSSRAVVDRCAARC